MLFYLGPKKKPKNSCTRDDSSFFAEGKKTQRAFITLPLVGPRSRRVSVFNKFPFALAGLLLETKVTGWNVSDAADS